MSGFKKFNLQAKKDVVTSSKVTKLKDEILNPKAYRNLNINIDTELLRDFKTKASQEGTTMTNILLDAIRAYLDN